MPPRFGWNWPVIILAALISIAAARPYAASWNDGSRLATVEALVDHHTLVIDRSIFIDVPADRSPYPSTIPSLRIGTQDKLFIEGHWYSDKSPLPALFLALVYWLLQAGTGLVAAQQPGAFCYWMTLVNSGLAYVLAVACIDRLGAALDLARRERLLLTASFALCTVALVYTQHVNNHVLFLGLASLLTLQLVYLAQEPAVSWRRLVMIGTVTGLAYSADLGVGPPLVATVLALVAWRTRPAPALALVLLGAGPWLVMHHAVNYAVGGTLKPANAVPEYLAWPGSPFSPQTMTGQLNHATPFHFFAYAIQLLFGKQGFALHNLATLLVLPVVVRMWRGRRNREPNREGYRPEVVWGLSWCLLSWLAYALTSNNYSGECLSIRWFVPLLAPLYLVLAVGVREKYISMREMTLLSAWGAVLMAIAWPGGPWTIWMVPGYWFVVGAALIGWGWMTLRRGRKATGLEGTVEIRRAA